MIVRIEIPGLPPTVNARRTLVRGRPMNARAVGAFQGGAAVAGLVAMRRAGVLAPLSVPVVVLITYRVAPTRRRDGDAGAKDVLDGLQGTVWTNDRLVVRHTPRIVPAEEWMPGPFASRRVHLECTIVHVAEAGDDADAAMAALLLGGLS